jgi:hypothetical protein
MGWSGLKIIGLGILANTIENLVLLLYYNQPLGKSVIISSIVFALVTVLFYELISLKEKQQ